MNFTPIVPETYFENEGIKRPSKESMFEIFFEHCKHNPLPEINESTPLVVEYVRKLQTFSIVCHSDKDPIDIYQLSKQAGLNGEIVGFISFDKEEIGEIEVMEAVNML